MKIGIVLPYLKAGGTERQARYIARYLRNTGHQVTFLVSEKKGIFAEEVDWDTVFLDVPFNKMSAPLLVYRLTEAAKNHSFDLLLSRAWNTNVVTALAGLLARIPYVLFLSGPSHRNEQPWVKLLAEGFLLRRAARIISVSEAAGENCIQAYGLSPSLVQVVHNGIRIDEIQTLAERDSRDVVRFSDKTFNVAFVGRLNHRKGLDILLRALHLLEKGKAEKGGDVQVVVWVVGGGDVQKYRRLAEELGIGDSVQFLGEKENPFPEMKQADLFVLPSRSEGFPNVLLEAMALGRPVLAADCETGPNEIIDGENGRLFPVGDAQALAREIESLIGNRQARLEIGQKGQKTVREHFSLEAQLATMEEILQRAASNS